MRMLKLGRAGPKVSAFGLGCMAMSGMYGPAEIDDAVPADKVAGTRYDAPQMAHLDSER